MASLKSFEELNCWKACREVVRWVSAITKTFPKEEKYDLVDNMKRASRSSTRNIAEGFGRHHHRENIQFCRISRGSLTELIDDLITSLDEGYLTKALYKEGRQKIESALQLVNGYIRYLESLL
ncbi:MAG: four helix bundle protein [Lewinellaceae bacterium]|nr:four helix bundle protein [Phaeodactylibacter sp.]MCB9039011.1 four helix bundle protein [Lewinellaceae bacterium]